jgi:hypothetical protein
MFGRESTDRLTRPDIDGLYSCFTLSPCGPVA